MADNSTCKVYTPCKVLSTIVVIVSIVFLNYSTKTIRLLHNLLSVHHVHATLERTERCGVLHDELAVDCVDIHRMLCVDSDAAYSGHKAVVVGSAVRLAAVEHSRNGVAVAVPHCRVELERGRSGVGVEALHELAVAVDVEALELAVATVVGHVADEEHVGIVAACVAADGEVERTLGQVGRVGLPCGTRVSVFSRLHGRPTTMLPSRASVRRSPVCAITRRRTQLTRQRLHASERWNTRTGRFPTSNTSTPYASRLTRA